MSAWHFAFFGAILVLLGLVTFSPDPYLRIIRFLPDGLWVTFQVTLGSIVGALCLGLMTGLGRLSSNRALRAIASLYVEVVRGIPLLVQLFYIYYALGHFVRVPDMVAAVLAMSVCYGAYMGEVYRAGIESIDQGQAEAARSLGLSRTQAMWLVILPQAWRRMLPPLGNECIALLKDTSLVSILAVADLLRRGREFASETFAYFETYTMIALIYLLITLLLSKLVGRLEARLKGHEVVGEGGVPRTNGDAMQRLVETLAYLGQRLPFTLAMLAGIILMGIATGVPIHNLDLALRQRWGFAFSDFSDGTWYSLFTSILMADRPLMFWGILLFVGCSVGVYEWLAGPRRAVWHFWMTDLGGNLGMALLVVLPLYSLGTSTGYALAHNHDVGMSGGGFGCLGGWMSRLPRRWRIPSLSLATVYLLVRLLVFTELFADLLHLLTFFGGYGYDTWRRRVWDRHRS